MPRKLEEALKREARKRGYSGERFDRYVYGTLAKLKKEGKIEEGQKDGG